MSCGFQFMYLKFVNTQLQCANLLIFSKLKDQFLLPRTVEENLKGHTASISKFQETVPYEQRKKMREQNIKQMSGIEKKELHRLRYQIFRR